VVKTIREIRGNANTPPKTEWGKKGDMNKWRIELRLDFALEAIYHMTHADAHKPEIGEVSRDQADLIVGLVGLFVRYALREDY
jgi:hypothetical protein